MEARTSCAHLLEPPLAADLGVRRTLYGDQMVQPLRTVGLKPISLVGAVLGVISLPHVYLVMQALLSLGAEPAKPGHFYFLDYHAQDVYRWAFVAAHGWLVWAIVSWCRMDRSTAFRRMIIFVGMELALVYGSVLWLRVLGYKLDLA